MPNGSATSSEQNTKHSGAAVRTALMANIGVAAAKMLAAVFTGSSAMMSESVHSLADCSNEIVLLVGRKLSVKRDDRHPFGLFRLKYLAGFLVATLLFLMGGLYSAVEAWGKLTTYWATPEHDPVRASSMLVVLIIVLISALLESYGLHGSISEARERMTRTGTPRLGMFAFWRETKSAELASTLMEDTLALIGLAFAGLGAIGSLLTGDAIWDALGGLMVGVTLIAGSLLLAWKNGSLLVGEGMEPFQADRVRRAVESTEGVNRLIEMQAVHTGDDSVLLCLKIETSKLDRDYDVETVNKVERNIRERLPYYLFEIYVEPDIFDTTREKHA